MLFFSVRLSIVVGFMLLQLSVSGLPLGNPSFLCLSMTHRPCCFVSFTVPVVSVDDLESISKGCA